MLKIIIVVTAVCTGGLGISLLGVITGDLRMVFGKSENSPIPSAECQSLEEAEKEYLEWQRTLSRMRWDKEFSEMVGYNRNDVITRLKELSKQIVVFRTSGLGNEVKSHQGVHLERVEDSEFKQEGIYLGEAKRRYVYR